MDGIAATVAGIACASRDRRGHGALEQARPRCSPSPSPSTPASSRWRWPPKPRAFLGDSGSQVIGFSLAAIALASSWKVAAVARDRAPSAPRARRSHRGHGPRRDRPRTRAPADPRRRARPRPARLLEACRRSGRSCDRRCRGGARRGEPRLGAANRRSVLTLVVLVFAAAIVQVAGLGGFGAELSANGWRRCCSISSSSRSRSRVRTSCASGVSASEPAISSSPALRRYWPRDTPCSFSWGRIRRLALHERTGHDRNPDRRLPVRGSPSSSSPSPGPRFQVVLAQRLHRRRGHRTLLIGLARLAERALRPPWSTLTRPQGRRRVLIVGAGRAGQSLLRELREQPGEQIVGFVDDNNRLRRRRTACRSSDPQPRSRRCWRSGSPTSSW